MLGSMSVGSIRCDVSGLRVSELRGFEGSRVEGGRDEG